MLLRLKELRKKAGYKSREKFCEVLGVSMYTYRAWESGVTTMNIEQLWQCCTALNVSPNEMLGWQIPTDEQQLISDYRRSTEPRKTSLLQAAKDAATLSIAEKNAQQSEFMGG